jgi:hypothetical protein
MDGRKTLTCGYGFQRTGWTGCTDLRIRYSRGSCTPDRTVMLADTNQQAERPICARVCARDAARQAETGET